MKADLALFLLWTLKIKKMSKRFKRKLDKRKQYNFIYIFTEGKKTEPIYFESKKSEIEKETRKKLIKTKTKTEINKGYKGGYNTKSLVDLAINFTQNSSNGFNFGEDECWVVFDKDDFDKDFDNAINKATKNGLSVAYSNEAFELWFLLHFNQIDSAIRRKDYNKKVTENYKKLTGDKKYKYDKVEGVYLLIDLIKDKEKDAIRNAKKLFQQFKNEKSFLKKNPSTTVHLLVEKLNKLKE